MPLPEPLAPEVTVIQATPLVAVQLQPAPDVTATLAGPPGPPALTSVGDAPKVHVDVAAACVTVTVCPATVSVPVRLDVAVLVATE